MQKVERPDLMTYQPHLTYSPLDARSLSPPSISPSPSPELKVCREDGGSPGGSTMQLQKTCIPLQQHFHRPDNGANIYMKMPNFKQEVSKQKVMGSIIQSSKFPAAQKPDPNLPSKIETEYWPCPPSLAAMEIEWRKRKEEEEEGKDEFEVLTSDAKTLQEQELHKIKSNLGRLILKEEKEEQEKALLDIGRRKTQSLPDRTHMHTSFSLKVSSISGLTMMQSAEFTTEGNQGKTGRLHLSCITKTVVSSEVGPTQSVSPNYDFVSLVTYNTSSLYPTHIIICKDPQSNSELITKIQPQRPERFSNASQRRAPMVRLENGCLAMINNQLDRA
ncbi:dematin-like isoform X2 [Oncorhynchus keta]|uniref:dematin-like isoform X2 n=2 Tax=Oncorhynchus keta TaxID=8018 RepID=UPI00227A59D9|nr:dematin-like isoform X2 [Oncorhynchus keta]